MTSYASQSGFIDNLNPISIQSLEDACWNWCRKMGFTQVRLPVVEQRALFERGVGNGTDVVEKEMFTLQGSENVLRPEGTAQAMRAWIAAGGIRYGQARWAYCGPMFRNERPQAGRFKQFQQFGCEMIGLPAGPGDADILVGLSDFFTELGLREKLTLKVNTLGTSAERSAYRAALQDWLKPKLELLDETSRKRFYTNPLRIWDSKEPGTKLLMADAPRLLDFLGDASRTYWDLILSLLDDAGVNYEIDTTLMRGLDYYNGLVFEWVTFENKAQNAVAAGGRYDGLAELLGGVATPAFGFAFGLERVDALRETESSNKRSGYYVVSMPETEAYALKVSRAYRNRGETVVLGDFNGKLAKQVQRADKLNARFVIILGPSEKETKSVTVKDLDTGLQETVQFLD